MSRYGFCSKAYLVFALFVLTLMFASCANPFGDSGSSSGGGSDESEPDWNISEDVLDVDEGPEASDPAEGENSADESSDQDGSVSEGENSDGEGSDAGNGDADAGEDTYVDEDSDDETDGTDDSDSADAGDERDTSDDDSAPGSDTGGEADPDNGEDGDYVDDDHSSEPDKLTQAVAKALATEDAFGHPDEEGVYTSAGSAQVLFEAGFAGSGSVDIILGVRAVNARGRSRGNINLQRLTSDAEGAPVWEPSGQSAEITPDASSFEAVSFTLEAGVTYRLGFSGNVDNWFVKHPFTD